MLRLSALSKALVRTDYSLSVQASSLILNLSEVFSHLTADVVPTMTWIYRSIIPLFRRISPVGLLMFAAIWPIFASDGLPAGADVSIHFWRTFDLGHSWASGDVLARWSELFYTGYGAPSFAYTGGAFYALATVIGELLGLGDVTRVKVAWAFSVMLLIWGTAHFATRRWGWAAGWVTAAALMFSPALYHTEALGRGSFGVILGFGSAMAGLALLQDIARGLTRRIWPASICLGVMMLSHNLTALQGAAVVGGWLVWTSLIDRAVSPDIRRAWLTFALGIGLSALLWIPALVDSGMTRLTLMNTDENLDFRNHFIALPFLLDIGQPFDSRLLNNAPHHRLGLPQMLLAVGALIGLFVYRRRWRDVLPWLLLTLVSTTLVLPESRGLWERLSILQQFLFPQRFLNTAAIGLAMMGGFAVSCIPMGRWKIIFPMGAIAMIIVYGYFIGQARWRTDFPEGATIRDYFDYEQTTGIYGGTSANEFLPLTVQLIPGATGFLMDSLAEGLPAQRLNPYTLPAGTSVTILRSHGALLEFTITTESAQTLEILQTYSPLWSATLNNQPYPTRPSTPYGFTLLDVPTGTHTIHLSYPLSGSQSIGLTITLLCAGGIVFISFITRKRNPKVIAPMFVTAPSGRVIRVLAGMVLVIGVLHINSAFQIRSAQGQAQAAHVQTDLTFTNGQHLLGYTVNALQPTAVREVLLYWETPLDDTSLNSFLHVLDANGQIIAQQDKLDITLPAPNTGFYIADRYILRFSAPPPSITQLRLGLWICGADINTYDCAARRDLGIYVLD